MRKFIASLCLLLAFIVPAGAGSLTLLGAGKPPVASSGCSQATTFLARTSGLDATHTTAYTNFICGMVTAGLWSGLDIGYLCATNTLATCRLNLPSTSFALVDVGVDPTFVADRGFTSIIGQMLSTQFTPSTDAVNCTLNSCTVAVWSNQATDTANGEFGALDNGTGSIFIYTGPSYNALTVNTTNTSDASVTTTGKGFFVAIRTSSTNRDIYLDGTFVNNNQSGTTTALPVIPLYFGGTNGNNFSGKQVSASFVMRGITSGEQTTFTALVQAFMTAVGN